MEVSHVRGLLQVGDLGGILGRVVMSEEVG